MAEPSLLAKPTVICAADDGALADGELPAEGAGAELPQAARPATLRTAAESTVSIRPCRVVMCTAAPVVREANTRGCVPVPAASDNRPRGGVDSGPGFRS